MVFPRIEKWRQVLIEIKETLLFCPPRPRDLVIYILVIFLSKDSSTNTKETQDR